MIEPEETSNDVRRDGFSGLLRSSITFVEEANDGLGEKAGDQDKLSFRVI